jgi:hypothetical protein
LSFGGAGGCEVTELYFPEEAIACLRRTRYNPAARPSLELVSGSFIWEDEFAGYVEFVAHCRARGCPRYWEPVGYRTSIIRGGPNERFRRGWGELRKVCPDWPGFREERYAEALRAELERQEADEP